MSVTKNYKERNKANSLYQAVFQLIDDNNKCSIQKKWNPIIAILKNHPLLETKTQYGNNIEDIIIKLIQ